MDLVHVIFPNIDRYLSLNEYVHSKTHAWYEYSVGKNKIMTEETLDQNGFLENIIFILHRRRRRLYKAYVQ